MLEEEEELVVLPIALLLLLLLKHTLSLLVEEVLEETVMEMEELGLIQFLAH